MFYHYLKRALYVPVLASLWLSVSAQSSLEQLQIALPALLEGTNTPAISIAIIEGGQVRWSTAMGSAGKQPASNETIFRGASLGKPLFAYGVLLLSQQGKLALDTPLINYVPQAYLEANFLKAPLRDDRLRLITARMVLNHTSGLPNWRSQGAPLSTMFVPGSRYSYSGEGYYLLQQVVEYLVNEPIEAFMQRTVFKPLGMTHTSYVYDPARASQYAPGYDGAGELLTNEFEAANVAHTVWTTADDYAKFVIAALLTKPGADQVANTLLGSCVSTDICQPGKVSWGLGVALQHTPSGDMFCQWAKSPAASGYLIGSADQKKAVVYLVNIANQGLRLAEGIVKLGIGYDDPLFACFGVKTYPVKP